jgi:hypothetical protein
MNVFNTEYGIFAQHGKTYVLYKSVFELLEDEVIANAMAVKVYGFDWITDGEVNAKVFLRMIDNMKYLGVK